MPRPPAWKITLEEARRQALIAIDFYNRPGDRGSYADFILHIHLAWQNLIHADRLQNNLEIFYRNKNRQRTFIRNKDRSKRTWDLAKCLQEEFPNNDPIRKNLEFFIGLRNHIEHRYQSFVIDATAPHAHACMINFESEVVRRFGDVYSLRNELRFPIFIHSLSPTSYEDLAELQRSVPQEVKSFIANFQDDLVEAVSSDEKYAYRLLLIPLKGPKTNADMALNFLDLDDLTPEKLQELQGKQGSVIIEKKYKNVANGDEVLPGKAAKQVQNQIEFKFSVNDFTRLRKHWKIGPVKSRSKDQLENSEGYCLYSPTFHQFVYLPKLVDRMVKELSIEGKYEEIIGHKPELKPMSE